MIRNPVVAGQFYPSNEKQLFEAIKSLSPRPADEKADAIAAVLPHAGYVFSGRVAAMTVAAMKPRHNYVIIGPNHTGLGSEFGISACEAWRTPLGDVRLNDALAEQIAAKSPLVTREDASSAHEHSIEVQLPLLQAVSHREFTFVPMVASYANISAYNGLGKAIAAALKAMKLEKDTVIIASSDMTHYESHESATGKDAVAIDAILELDQEKLIACVTKHDISMCGYAPAAIMLAAAKELGATTARLVKYETSGEASGDYSSVVGYAGILIT